MKVGLFLVMSEGGAVIDLMKAFASNASALDFPPSWVPEARLLLDRILLALPVRAKGKVPRPPQRCSISGPVSFCCARWPQ